VSLPSTPFRRTGVLIGWRLSKSGGHGRIFIPTTGEFYFICKNFISSGVPLVGSAVTFTPGPLLEGRRHAAALDCSIDNARIIRAMPVPGLKKNPFIKPEEDVSA